MSTADLKIAISGSAGIGKSTLAADLAESLQLELIDENFQPLFSNNVYYGPAGPLKEAFWKVFRNKSQLEDNSPGFVTDRCPIDLFHNWLIKDLGADRKATEEFFKACHGRFSAYDFIVVPPWGSFQLEQLGPERGGQKRNMNPLVQLRNHATILGYIHLWISKRKIIEIPGRVVGRQQRVEFVREAIRRRQLTDDVNGSKGGRVRTAEPGE